MTSHNHEREGNEMSIERSKPFMDDYLPEQEDTAGPSTCMRMTGNRPSMMNGRITWVETTGTTGNTTRATGRA